VQHCWFPVTDDWGATSEGSIAVAGDGARIRGAAAAPLTGRLAALDAAARLGLISLPERDARARPLRAMLARSAPGRRLLDRMFAPAEGMRVPPDPDDLLCRCEEVTRGEVEAAVGAGADDCNQVKTATRSGMGPCQGRMCGMAVAEVVASAKGTSVEEVVPLRMRFPIKPLPLAAFAALEEGSEEARA